MSADEQQRLNLTDTHRRAAIRGREAVARWRIDSGVWASWIYAVLYLWSAALMSVISLGREWPSALLLALLAAGFFYASRRMLQGSRVAAAIVLAMVLLAEASTWMSSSAARHPLYAVIGSILIIALVNGLWGTFLLERVRRDAATIPPRPRQTAEHRP